MLHRSWLAPALCCCALATGVRAQSVKLNDPLAEVVGNDVKQIAVSPDGAWIVYLADALEDGVVELFSVPSDGSAPPVRLNDPLPAGASVLALANGDGRVAFIATTAAVAGVRVWSRPYDGSSAPVALSLTASLRVPVQLWLSPDGTHVVYESLAGLAFYSYLDSVPIDGSQPAIEIARSDVPSWPGAFDTGFDDVVFTGDGQRVVCAVHVDHQNGSPTILLQVRVDGSQPALELYAAGFVVDPFGGYVVSADGSRVAYSEPAGALATVGIDGTDNVVLAPSGVTGPFHLALDGSRVVFVQSGDLFSAQSDGSLTVQLDPPGTLASAPALTPDGTRVVFVASGVLHVVPLDGSAAATPLTGAGATGDFVLTPDSTRAVAVLDSAGFRGVHAVPLSGGGPVLLNGPAQPGRGVTTSGQTLALAGARVLYRQDRALDEVAELFAAPLDASAPEVRLSSALGGASDVVDFAVAGAHVAYRADAAFDETVEAFRAPLDASAPAERLHAPFAAGTPFGDVLTFRTAANAGRAVYLADQDQDERPELYSARADGRGSPRRISADAAVHGNVLADFATSATTGAVAYQAFATGGNRLYAASATTAAPALELDAHSQPFVAPFVLTPLDERVVYRKAFAAGGFELFSVRMDGVGAAVRLDANAVSASSVLEDLALGGLGRIVYRANQTATGRPELFSVPDDAGALPVKLNGPLVAGGRVLSHRVRSDGQVVVYLAEQDTAGVAELFVVPVVGGLAPLRLHPALGANRDVLDYVLSSAGPHVVFRGDLAVDGQNELFRSDGVNVLRLTTLAAGEDVEADHALSADGTRVVYRAGSAGGPRELFVVPADGSAAPLQLSAPLVAGGNVTAFAISPDGAWVVYLADQRVNDVFELHRVPLAGGPAVAYFTLGLLRDVESFRIAPDSAHVVYRVDLAALQAFGLYASPLDGSAAPKRLNEPLATDGDVQTDWIALPGARALFRADQEADERFELFLGHATHGPRPSGPP